MKKDRQTVVAVRDSGEEVLETVNRLMNEGYNKQDITVYANKNQTGFFDDMKNVRVEREQGVWDKIKDRFQTKEEEDDVLKPYAEDIRSGKYLVIVNDYRGEQDDTLRLKEEQLDIDKHEVETGEVDVTKNVVREVETIEVPVEREELVVEKRSFEDEDDTETIRIPLKEEKVEVRKKPVVKEEVSVRKEVKQEMKHVSADVRKEKLDVETEGDARVDKKEQ